MGKKKRAHVKWTSPPRGRLKLNVDGAFDLSTNRGGVGVVCRDEGGRSIIMLAKSYLYAHSALAMLAEVCTEGLLLGISQEWGNIDVESDSYVLVAALNSSRADLSEVGRIIEDCKRYLLALPSSSIRHIFREANCVADYLAHFACNGFIDSVWVEDDDQE
ncbi:uncharacterized protein LOC126802611 [Argentina anserina]|uniref:uncharacterized protein LOC126802611 n=1 Tax=Argentina anserina TaxID=57926 RepID=UPI00217692F3|nr:uncharacterized protein LOC126802611 [Potentilla anserina]